MKLTEYNAKVLVEGTDEEHSFLYDYLAFRDKQRDFLARTRKWMDPFVRMYATRTCTFPAGLRDMAMYAAESQGYPVEYVDKRVCPAKLTADLPTLMAMGLRDYQAEALLAVGTNGRGIVKIATAGGKGSLAAAFPQAIDCPWLFLVHRAQIAEDIGRRYRAATKMEPGFVLDGRSEPGEGQFVVATFQSFRKRAAEGWLPGWLEKLGGVVYDEAHTIGAETFAAVADSLAAPYYRVGMSGTPLQRGDGRSGLVLAHTGTVIYEATASELVAAGWVAPVRVTALWYEQPGPVERATWAGVYKEAVVRSTPRAKMVVNVVAAAPKPALVFVNSLQHGRALVKMLERAGMRARFAQGSVSTDRRESMNKDLVDGRLDVVVASKVYEEGIDIPSLAAVIHAGGGKSEIGTLQRLGRGMRLSPGKTHVEMIDILDGPCPECAAKKKKDPTYHKSCRWLATHSAGRVASYRREKHPVVEAHTIAEALANFGAP